MRGDGGKVGGYVVYGVMATMPILFGAVRSWVWSVYTVAIFATYAWSLWRDGFDEKRRMEKGLQAVVIFFFAWSIFQILPLPAGLAALLSKVKQANTATGLSLLGEPLSWQTLSYSLPIALAEIAFCLGLFLFYRIFTGAIEDRFRFKTIIIIIMALGAAEALYGVVQALVPAVGVLWVDSSHAYFGIARGTYINRNSFAGFIEMVMPITLGYAMAISYWPVRGKLKQILSQDRLNQTIFMAMMIMLMLLALVFSQSRAGILGGGIAVLMFVIIARKAARQKTAVAWVLTSAIGILFLVYGFSIGFEPVIERFLGISKDTSRLDIWKDTLGMIRDHPFGVGPGNYDRVYPVYHVHFNPHYRVLDAHNDYLQFLAESGWPGFAVLTAGFIYFLGTRIWRIARMDVDREPFSFFISAGAVCGLSAIVFHSFFDFNLQIPANALYFTSLAAIADRGVTRHSSLVTRHLSND